MPSPGLTSDQDKLVAQMAPLVKRLLSPQGDVVYDTRTNTLIVID